MAGFRSEINVTRQVQQLIERDGPSVVALAFRLTRNADDAQELAQEAYRRVVRHWRRYGQRRSLSPLCSTIVKHLYLDGRKRYETQHVLSLDHPVSEEGPEFGESIPYSEDGILESLERRETVELVRRALRGMRSNHRAVLTMCDMEGTRYSEAAHMIGVPLGTLRSRLHRARLVFRQRYPGFAENGRV